MSSKILFKSFFACGSGLLLPTFCSFQVIILFCLVIVDLFLGTFLALKFRVFKVYSFSKTAFKVFFYSITILASASVDCLYNFHLFLVQGFVIPFLVITEVLSVLQFLTELGWLERFPRFTYWIRNE